MESDCSPGSWLCDVGRYLHIVLRSYAEKVKHLTLGTIQIGEVPSDSTRSLDELHLDRRNCRTTAVDPIDMNW